MPNLVLQSAHSNEGVTIVIICILIWLAFYYNYRKTNKQLKRLNNKKEKKYNQIDPSVSWDCISSWFQNVKDRKVVVREFNNAAQSSYIDGLVPYQLKSIISKGNKEYKHSTSAWLNSGFRIIVMTDNLLSDAELNMIGLSVLADSKIVRFLITQGWDTLEVININEESGIQWELAKWANVQEIAN